MREKERPLTREVIFQQISDDKLFNNDKGLEAKYVQILSDPNLNFSLGHKFKRESG